MDIRMPQNATVEMAIADFFHCENIPDAAVESPRFKRFVTLPMCREVSQPAIQLRSSQGRRCGNIFSHMCFNTCLNSDRVRQEFSLSLFLAYFFLPPNSLSLFYSAISWEGELRNG